ncbi:conserved hypothetical protein [Ricinus communis]|uniref:Late embryogenesis abundant protein LEA-2 subgroup domain-containing protein n=1 Tax=Ricinus communis TaxID=3988 RepID=B9SD04_RICCO|nr:conserved hypothetical protein [Ricinus communis]
MSHTSSIRSSVCDCLFGFVFIITLAFLISATPAVIRFLILLQPTLPTFTSNSSSLSLLNASSNINIPITAHWNLVLSIHNPNTNPISYHPIEATSLLPYSHASSTLIPSFVQTGNVQENIQVAFTNMFLQFTNCSSTTGPDQNISSCGAINLTMEMQARATYEGWTWPAKTDTVKVVCRQDLKVQFPLIIATLNFDSSNTTCDVNGRWKTLVTNWNSFFWNYLYFVMIAVLGTLHD